MRKLVLLVVCLVAGCGPDGSRGISGKGGNGGSGGSAGAGGAGASGGTGGSNLGNGPSFSDMCNGQKTTITGTIMAPNGVDPIANAFAYIPASTGSFPNGVSCDLCGMPVDGVAAQATTNPNGTFTLDISSVPAASTLPFTVNMGRFRRQSMINVTACQENPIGAPATVLPGKAANGDDIPKIAVATGNKDQLDAVLAAMGMDMNAGFDCYEGRKSSTTALMSPCGTKGTLPAIETLLTNETMLETYNLLFLSCAPGKFASLPAATQMQIASNLQTWTGKGGRLFVTDNSYDYIAQAFPAAVMFVNGNTTVDAANVGVGGTSTSPTSYTGQVNDTTMLAWLTAVSAIPNGMKTLTLSGYLNKWSVMQSVPMGTTDEVDATNAVITTGTTMSAPGSYPQTIKFDITPMGGQMACGRGIYTSYHTLPSTQMVDATNLAPQERILEYLMFEAGACVGMIN